MNQWWRSWFFTPSENASPSSSLEHEVEFFQFRGQEGYQSLLPIQLMGGLLLMTYICGIVAWLFFDSMMTSFTRMFSLNLNSGFIKGLLSVGGAMLRMAGFVGVLLIPLQGLSRAIEKIKLENMFDLASLAPKIAEWMNSLQLSMRRFMAPINDLIDGFASMFESLIRMLPFMGRGSKGLIGIMDALTGTVEVFSKLLLGLWSVLKGLVAGVSAILGNVFSGNFTNLGGDFQEAFTNEFEKSLNRLRTPTIGADGEQTKTVTNYVNQDIKMNNSFKEVLQPDRIAFTIQDQLAKAARNRSSGSGGSNRPKLAVEPI